MMPFCCLQNNENEMQACSEQTVKHTTLWHSLKESQFCMEHDPICFKSIRPDILKLWLLLYRHAKVQENAVKVMVTCSYKWLTNNVCISSMKLTYSSQDSLFHSKSIHIDFKLTTPTVQELWSSQVKVDVTEEVLSI